jgi:hypothetical protein
MMNAVVCRVRSRVWPWGVHVLFHVSVTGPDLHVLLSSMPSPSRAEPLAAWAASEGEGKQVSLEAVNDCRHAFKFIILSLVYIPYCVRGVLLMWLGKQVSLGPSERASSCLAHLGPSAQCPTCKLHTRRHATDH